MAYNKTNWENGVTPINEGNLNKMEEGIYQNSINIEGIIPAGIVTAYGGINAPTGWLICDGSEVSRTTYNALFNAIGITYGEGNGTTTFNLPDLKGKVIIGVDSEDEDFDTTGKSGGEKTHQLVENELPRLTGSIIMHSAADRTNIQNVSGKFTSGQTNSGKFRNGGVDGTGANSVGVVNWAIGNNGSHNILQPYTVVNYIIKY